MYKAFVVSVRVKYRHAFNICIYFSLCFLLFPAPVTFYFVGIGLSEHTDICAVSNCVFNSVTVFYNFNAVFVIDPGVYKP